jgi:hypothetical protein
MCRSGGQMKFHPSLQHHYQVQGMVENELYYYHSWKGFAYLLCIQGGEIMWWLYQELQTKDMYGNAKKNTDGSILIRVQNTIKRTNNAEVKVISKVTFDVASKCWFIIPFFPLFIPHVLCVKYNIFIKSWSCIIYIMHLCSFPHIYDYFLLNAPPQIS